MQNGSGAARPEIFTEEPGRGAEKTKRTMPGWDKPIESPLPAAPSGGPDDGIKCKTESRGRVEVGIRYGATSGGHKSNVAVKMNWRGSTMRKALGVPSGKTVTG